MSVLSDQGIKFDREAGFAIQQIMANDYAYRIASTNRQSVINAVTNVAAIGISLNPASKQAYLVPRKNQICLDISYMGMMHLAIESGSLMWAQADVVREMDTFQLQGYDKPPVHNFNPFAKDRGDIVGVYVVAKTAAGDYLTDCMSREEVDAIMNRTESVKSGRSSPWKTDYAEMAKKTVVKRAEKYWPKTERLSKAIHHLNTDGGEGIEIAQPKESPSMSVEMYIDRINECQTQESLMAEWQKAVADMQRVKDRDGYARIKEACQKQRSKIMATVDDQEPSEASE